MHVVHIITRGDDLGGAQAHVRDLSVALRERGHQVTVMAGQDGPFGDVIRGLGLPYRALRHLVHPVHPASDALALAELVRELRHLRADLVHTHSSKAGILGRLACRVLGIPVVHTAHGWAFHPVVPAARRRAYRFVERAVAPLARRVITVSEADHHLARRRWVVSSRRLRVVHNGLPDIPTRAEPEAAPIRLVTVVRLEVPKDTRTLLQACARLPSELDWGLQIVGDGRERPELEALSQRLGLTERASFLGFRSDVDALLAEASVFVLVSDREGLPISILEAMRVGLPTVATHVGGIPELVVHERTGLLVPPRDALALALALERYARNPELRQRHGAAARARFVASFTQDRMVDAILTVYEEALHGPPSTSEPT